MARPFAWEACQNGYCSGLMRKTGVPKNLGFESRGSASPEGAEENAPASIAEAFLFRSRTALARPITHRRSARLLQPSAGSGTGAARTRTSPAPTTAPR